MLKEAEKIAAALLTAGAVKFNLSEPFVWTSGIKSPIYCDNRLLISHVAARELIVAGFVAKIEKVLEVDYIAGTATAAIPWAAFVAQTLRKPLIYVRPEKKAHGAGRQIEGDLRAGSRVLLLEDLISTGGSSLRAAAVIEEEGGSTCDEIVAIVTYGLKQAVETFAAAEKRLTALTNFECLFAAAQDQGLIGSEEKVALGDFLADPHGWAERRGF